jgi:hypothetical protein
MKRDDETIQRVRELVECAGFEVLGTGTPRELVEYGGEWHPATAECPGNYPMAMPIRLDPDFGPVSVGVRCDCRRIG